MNSQHYRLLNISEACRPKQNVCRYAWSAIETL